MRKIELNEEEWQVLALHNGHGTRELAWMMQAGKTLYKKVQNGFEKVGIKINPKTLWKSFKSFPCVSLGNTWGEEVEIRGRVLRLDLTPSVIEFIVNNIEVISALYSIEYISLKSKTQKWAYDYLYHILSTFNVDTLSIGVETLNSGFILPNRCDHNARLTLVNYSYHEPISKEYKLSILELFLDSLNLNKVVIWVEYYDNFTSHFRITSTPQENYVIKVTSHYLDFFYPKDNIPLDKVGKYKVILAKKSEIVDGDFLVVLEREA